MSINDILNDDSFLIFLVVGIAIALIIFLPLSIAGANKSNKKIYGDDDYYNSTVENNAKILRLTKTPHPLNNAVMINTVVVEFENGTRKEFAVKDHNQYNLLAEGDVGKFEYSDKKFISFERNM